MTNETRSRFLAAIAAQLPAERIAEVHLFPAIRQGGMESGVAVVAVELPGAIEADAAVDQAEDAQDRHAEDTEESIADDEDDTTALKTNRSPAPAPRRYTVFSARYRHTLKGPDRGKWEASVTEEADAPLLTVDAVVRGVQRRSGDVDEIVRLSGDEVRATIPAPAAT
jgi:hypothetical protein